MPIEVKELNIKINVSEQAESSGQNSNANAKEAIIAECVEQVMQILSQKQER